MTKQHRCPQCNAETAWKDNPHRPFCSERCRLIDLGHWADGSYRIPAQPSSPEDIEELIAVNQQQDKDLKGNH